MVSDFRKKKLLHVFNAFFDADGSGVIEENDFKVSFHKIAEMRGWKPEEPAYQEAKKTLIGMWTELQKEVDKDNNGQVTKEEWIQRWDEYAKNPSKQSEWQKLYCKFMFQVEDASNDGEIDSEEFSSVYASFGLDKQESIEAFKKMAKGKKTVNWEQFQELWTEYYTTEDQAAPGNFIYGCYMCSMTPHSHSH